MAKLPIAGVLPAFARPPLPTFGLQGEMCMHLTQGNCVVFEVKHNDPKVNPVCAFRKICGPRDPDVCRQLYPDTIRARFGKDLVHNAVHCTDLPEDGEMEIEYFFKLLVNEF